MQKNITEAEINDNMHFRDVNTEVANISKKFNQNQNLSLREGLISEFHFVFHFGYIELLRSHLFDIGNPPSVNVQNYASTNSLPPPPPLPNS